MVTAGDAAAIIVTRGDVEIEEIRRSLIFPEVMVWDNTVEEHEHGDLGAYGRYEAIKYVEAPIVFFQDDDCLVSLVDQVRLVENYEPGVVTALMPPERVDYVDTVLIGWGAIFDRDLPAKAFARWQAAGHSVSSRDFLVVGADFVFPMLTPWKRLACRVNHLPHAHAPNRTWASYPDYAGVKERYLREARTLRDKEKQGVHR